MESIVVTGDLILLSAEDRVKFYVQVCEAMHLDVRTRPLQYFEQIDRNGKHSLILYALRNASVQLSHHHGLSVSLSKPEIQQDVVIFTATVTDMPGRTDSAVGAQSLKGLSGKDYADAIMAAQTKAKRRAILDFVGSGLLDESEIEGMNGAPVEMKSDLIDSYVPPPPAPVPSSAPAVEVSEVIDPGLHDPLDEKLSPSIFNPNPPFEIQPPPPTEKAAKQYYGNKMTDPGNTAFSVNSASVSTFESPAVSQTESQTMDQITARLNTYRRDVLQRGGMRPAKGLGIAAKWEKFRARKVAEKTVEEYAKLLSELDAVLAKSGDVGVVAFIEKEIA